MVFILTVDAAKRDLVPVLLFLHLYNGLYWTSRGGSDSKESACNSGAPSSIPGSGRSPGEGNGYQLQYSCLENSMNRGAWQVTVHGIPKSWTWQQLTSFSFFLSFFLRDTSVILGLGRSLGGGLGRTEVPGGLQSIGSQRVRHNWSELAFTQTHTFSHTP